MSNKISHSRLTCYNECGRKYFYKYIEKLYKDEVPTPLLFGIAIDEALNYVLKCKRDNLEMDYDKLKSEFTNYLSTYNDENIVHDKRVAYTANDIDYYLMTEDDIEHFKQYDPDFGTIPTATQTKQKE